MGLTSCTLSFQSPLPASISVCHSCGFIQAEDYVLAKALLTAAGRCMVLHECAPKLRTTNTHKGIPKSPTHLAARWPHHRAVFCRQPDVQVAKNLLQPLLVASADHNHIHSSILAEGGQAGVGCGVDARQRLSGPGVGGRGSEWLCRPGMRMF